MVEVLQEQPSLGVAGLQPHRGEELVAGQAPQRDTRGDLRAMAAEVVLAHTGAVLRPLDDATPEPASTADHHSVTRV